MSVQINPPVFCITGFASICLQLRSGFWGEDFQHLDAPPFLPAGSMVKAYGNWIPTNSLVVINGRY